MEAKSREKGQEEVRRRLEKEIDEFRRKEDEEVKKIWKEEEEKVEALKKREEERMRILLASARTEAAMKVGRASSESEDQLSEEEKVRKLVETAKSEAAMNKALFANSVSEDVEIAKCLASLGIKPGESRDPKVSNIITIISSQCLQ